MSYLCLSVSSLLCLAVLACSAVDSAAPVVAPADPITDLDDIGLYRIGYVLRGQPERDLPVGWTGPSDDSTGVTLMPQGVLDGRRALLLHPPWRTGPGVAYQEFHLQLPNCRSILLRGATAMRDEAVDKSDGVTFRVLMDGRKLLETHRDDEHWSDFELDLTEYVGKTVILRFETDPGPADDTNWDHAMWGGRQLVMDGIQQRRGTTRKSPPPLDLRRMQSKQNGSVVPLCGFDADMDTDLRGGTAVLRYTGIDGALEYRWTKPDSSSPLLGRIELTARTSDGVSVLPLALSSTVSWVEPAEFESSAFERTPSGVTCHITYKVGDVEAVLRVAGRIEEKSLVFDISCNRSLIGRLDAGGWSPIPIRKQIPVPYYSGQVFYIPTADLFVGGFLDWTYSNASAHENTVATYSALTDGSRRSLKERVVFTAARHLAETLPNIPNPPSPYIRDVGERIVLDVWGGRYTDIAGKLEALWDYGVTDCAAIIHAWQSSGYDNALPAHYPANEGLGGDEGMKTLVATARRLGYLLALHENYMDYYPNYDFFDETDIALNSDGSRVLGWFNPGTGIQAFQIKPNAMLRLAATQSPEIHRRYNTNASYLDVHSAVPPWWRVDCRAGERGAGRFRQFADSYVELWQYQRDTHKGPVFGEGNNHWFWSGHLDGVEAEFGSGWGHAQGRTAPLAVDFGLMRIRPLQINHGMGYYERWHKPLGYSRMPPMLLMDQYRMQEMAYGHVGFLGSTTWSHVPLAWLEHHLLTPVTSRHSLSRVVNISYLVNGAWVDATAAAKADVWDRVRVRYDNGIEITANGGPAALRIYGVDLPQYGWMAKGAGVTAYTALIGGLVADYAETKDSVFANARRASDWDYAKVWNIVPSIRAEGPGILSSVEGRRAERTGGFEQTGPRKFRLTYEWQVGERPPEDYTCFVHFVGRDANAGDEGIRFQDDHKIPDSAWNLGQLPPSSGNDQRVVTMTIGPRDIEIPGDVSDGDYACYVGFYRPDFRRLPIVGADPRHRRVLVGTIHISDGGSSISFTPEAARETPPAETNLEHLNVDARVIDFGAVRTNGSVLIRRDGDDWVLTPMPRERPFTIELKAAKFGKPEGVFVDKGWWRLTMNGAKEYRWNCR